MRKRTAAIICFGILPLFVFGCLESAETGVPKLVEQLADKESKVRNRAALKLGDYGEDAAPAVVALSRLLGDPNSGVRTSAAYSLRRIGTPEATKALDDYRK